MLSRPSTLYNSTLKHLVYDGVYADSEERLMGGGSLELKKNVTKELNLNKNSITGNWDYSHNLQLVWADVLKKKPFCLEKLKYTSQLWKLCIVVKLRHISLRRLKSLKILHNGGRVGGRKTFDLLILHSGHSMGHTKVYMHFQYDFY